MHGKSIRVIAGLIIVSGITLILSCQQVSAQLFHKTVSHAPASAPCPVACQTEYRAGEQASDLQVHLTGRSLQTLEMYFQNEVYRDQIPGDPTRPVCPCVLLAPKNPLGTFAVRFGECGDAVVAYAWHSDVKTKPVSTNELRPFPGESVAVRWMTDRILKIVPGADNERSLIIRFTNSPASWERFDSSTNTWSPLNNPVASAARTSRNRASRQ